MPGDEGSSRDSQASRRYLEKLLADCRRANLPGGQQLIEKIEQALAALPPADEDAPPPRGP